MNSTIEIPLWLLCVLIVLAVVTSLQYFLLPPVRRLMRRRANKVIDEVNSRLALELPSFKLTKREVLIDRLVYHPQVMQEVEERARTENTSRDVILQQVREYATEIVPAFNAWLYFKWAYWLARRIVHVLYRVRLGFADDQALKNLPANASVVFVMNHRSNMDYIVATYLAAERTSLSYAVGEWARVWPLQQLIRSMGGYFVRRDSGDSLYRQVLQCYVQMAAEGGVPQAVFPEGGLSRDGKLRKPKLGLLGYLAKPFLERQSNDQHNEAPSGIGQTVSEPIAGQAIDSMHELVFIPVGINYDRVLEDRTLLASLDKSKPSPGTFFTVKRFCGFIAHQIRLALTGRWYRFGYACVNFGTPLLLSDWVASREIAGHNKSDWHHQVEALGEELMTRIGSIIPILPVAVVASIVRNNTRSRVDTSLSEIDIKRLSATVIDQLAASGSHVYIPRNNLDYAVTVGLRMLVLRHILVDEDGWYRVNPENSELLDFYASSIEHLWTDTGPDNYIAVVNDASGSASLTRQTTEDPA